MGFVYTHLSQNEDIGFQGRSYNAAECLLDYNGRQVLYLYVDAADVTFCDRSYASHLASVTVKGYVLKWRCGINEEGEAISEIEPITDVAERRAVTDLLRSTVHVSSVHFF